MTKNHWSKLKLNWKWTTCLFHVFSLTPADFYSCQLITLFHLINQAIVINWNVCMYAEWQMLHSERASGEPAVSSHALQSLFHFYRQINTNAEDFRTWILMQVIKHGFFFFLADDFMPGPGLERLHEQNLLPESLALAGIVWIYSWPLIYPHREVGRGGTKAMGRKDSHMQDTDKISSFFLTVLVNIKVVEQTQHDGLKL